VKIYNPRGKLVSKFNYKHKNSKLVRLGKDTVRLLEDMKAECNLTSLDACVVHLLNKGTNDGL